MHAGPSLEDLRYQVQPVGHRRRVFLHALALIDLGDLVGTQALGLIQRVGHRHDLISRSGGQLIHEIDDSGEFVLRIGKLIVGKSKHRQHRDVLYLIFIE